MPPKTLQSNTTTKHWVLPRSMPAKRPNGVQQRRVAMPMFPQFHRRTPAQQQAHHVGHVAATVVHVWVDGEMQRRPSVDEGLGVDVGAGKHQDFAKSGQTGFECTAWKNGGRRERSTKRTRHIDCPSRNIVSVSSMWM